MPIEQVSPNLEGYALAALVLSIVLAIVCAWLWWRIACLWDIVDQLQKSVRRQLEGRGARQVQQPCPVWETRE